MKCNIVGGGFRHTSGGHTGYSIHGKISKHIEWVDSGGTSTFYVDNGLLSKKIDNIPSYGWQLECKEIRPIEKFFNHDFINSYELFFTNDKTLLNFNEKCKFVPMGGFWIKQPKLYDKTKLVSFITSNKNFLPGHKTRLQWLDRVRNDVDIFGIGFNPIEYKEEGLCDYMFSFAIENAVYETWFTEKLLDCFATGTVPIYLGTPDIGDFFNTDGMIILDETFDIKELSTDLYHSKLDAIKENLELCLQYEVLEDYIFRNYL